MKSTYIAKRELWIDNLKGLCLLLIVIGHLGTIPKPIGFILRPTDLVYVTIFFFLSGWLFRNDKYSFTDFTTRKVRSLLVPYIAICCAVSLFDWNLYLKPTEYMLDAMRCCIMGDGVPKASPLWFVSTLFFANILLKTGYCFTNRCIRTIYFLSLPFVCYILYLSEIRLPMRIDSAIGACFVMYSAQITKQCIIGKPYLQNICLMVSLALGVYGVISNLGLLNYNTLHTWMSFPCAIGGCMIVVAIFRQNFNIKLPPPIWIAKNGLPVLGFHCLLSFYLDVPLKLIKPLNGYFVLFFKTFVIFAFLYFVAIPLMKKVKPTLWGLQ